MSKIINKVKEKTSGVRPSAGNADNNDQQHRDSEEQRFGILPHPAKSNNPAELENPQAGAGLNDNLGIQAHHAHGPHIPSRDVANNLEQPASREELRKRGEELNK
ncbi:hypothetical protein SERLA73DRAFT_62207 [Serpula lacrymans var. lacrymans S7.3]|uniref:Uncharacterized protein n=2 Tax=Serpula lacrymans var. lacrymans TaxID=341189 RepID=F8QB36_SERL3|nr:uncharacterized protein SERLADRAFT_442720 [Serpula lacrymans var. lacrymans S7.9]EGN94422.1 hypothetical protein SERLA73DRAFT_62207 [Serpula lacrymans var. lacrymans S7.3]EGO19904.1 hypothetical protein SERLADRAFT_442720 [Serpula lacrymans var. lacrymans S7.9]